MTINTVADTGCYLYLNLDTNSEADLPMAEATRAFCAGYVCGLIKSCRDDDPIVAMQLGSGEQFRAIISAIQEKASELGGTSLRAFLEGRGKDPKKNPYLILKDVVTNLFADHYDARAEVDDYDLEPASVSIVQMGFVAGFQTLLYLRGERQEMPIGMDGRLWTDKQATELAEEVQRLRHVFG